MLSDKDRKEIDALIADRLEADHVVSIFTAMDERQKEILAQSLMPFVRSQKPPLRSPENFYTLRWTQDDADVNTSVEGSTAVADQRGFVNPTLPRWVDHVGGTSWLDPDDAQIVHFRGGGGGTDCMFDYLVSECWADEVAANRGTEGQTFTSLTGCTFKVYSTVNGAIGDINTQARSRMSVVFICAGNYLEVLTTPTSDISFIGAGREHFRGSGSDASITKVGGATSASDTLTLGSPPVRIEMQNFTFTNSTAGNGISLGTTNEVFMSHMTLLVTGAFKGIVHSGVNDQYLWMNDCEIEGDSTSTGLYFDSANGFIKLSHVWVRDCATGIVATARAQLSNVYIGIGPTSGKGLVIQGGSGGAKNFQSSNLYIDGNGGSTTIGIDIRGSSGSDNIDLSNVQIRDCNKGIDFTNTGSIGTLMLLRNINMDGVTTGIDWGASTFTAEVMMFDCHGVSLTGAGGPRSLRIYDSTGSSGQKIDTVMGNGVLGMLNHRDFSRTLTWGQFYMDVGGTRVSVAAGTHTYSLFDGSSYYVSVSTAGVMNVTTTGAFTAGEIPIGIVDMNTNRIESIDHYDTFFKTTATGAPPAPGDAQFLTLATSTGLSAERVFTPRYNLYATDGGANGNYTVDSWLEGAQITPSAGTLTLGTDGDVFHVAAGNFSAIATPTRQTLVVLVYDGVSVITHGANLILAGATNYTTAAGDTSIFLWEGSTVWRELSRWPASSSAGGVGSHPFVGTEHTGDDNYTLRPNVLALGVGGAAGTRMVQLFSDAGSTETGEWDAATGHFDIGNGGIASNIIMQVGETFAGTNNVWALYFSVNKTTADDNIVGIEGFARAQSATGTTPNVIASNLSAYQGGDGALTTLIGAQALIGSEFGASGAITDAIAQSLTADWAGDVPATIYGVKMGDLGGTGATVRPLYIPNQTGLTDVDVYSIHEPHLRIGNALQGALRIGSDFTPDKNTPFEIFLTRSVSNSGFNIVHIRPVINEDTPGSTAKVGISVQPTFAWTVAGSYTGNMFGVRVNPKLQPHASATLTGANSFTSVPTLDTSGTITNVRGLWVNDPVSASGGTITNNYGVVIDALTVGGTNIGFANSSNSRQTGYARFGSQTIPTNVTDGDITGARLFLADGAVLATGAIANITGPIALAEAAAPGTPSADAIAIYNETNSDALKMIDDTGDVWRLSHKHVINCTVDGTVTNQKTVVGPMPHAGEVFNVYSKTCDGVTIGATDWKGDVYLIPAANANTDGGTTSIFSGSLPTIADMYQSYGAPNTTAFAEGDYFSFATTQVGSSATMVTMSLHVRWS